jgi:hypothetical protein
MLQSIRFKFIDNLFYYSGLNYSRPEIGARAMLWVLGFKHTQVLVPVLDCIFEGIRFSASITEVVCLCYNFTRKAVDKKSGKLF